MLEKWAHRADLAEAAVNERHGAKLWGLPATNLGVVAWPARSRDKIMLRWHYWWQAHYLDCLVDAAVRRATPARVKRIVATVRGVRVRNLAALTKNQYFDDKAWMALALGRVNQVPSLGRPTPQPKLCADVARGCDAVVGVLPWRANETFFNAPTNGPAAILLARESKLAGARVLVDWMLDNLINDRGLVVDGIRMTMDGPIVEPAIYTYNQGVMLGALTEVAHVMNSPSYRGVAAADSLGAEDRQAAVEKYASAARILIHAIARDLTNPQGVIVGADRARSGGDGGLFNGILARYLALAAHKLPGDDPAITNAKLIARRLVLTSAESVWNYRLEVDGLPVFPAKWDEDTYLPRNAGVVGSSLGGSVGGSTIAERDLSVQLSGWMLMEAAAFLTRDDSAPNPGH